MAQKTLIIGLGSTGLSIARDVLERIRDEFGSLERVPWVEAACFETARVADDDLLKGRVGDLGISSTQYETLVGNLDQYGDMDALAWTDQKALQAKDLAQGTTDGAGNVRMIGRLCWIYRDNLADFQTLILEKLSALTSLNETTASKALGSWPYQDGPPSVSFTREPNANNDRIAIYICGTLTGGTCSGSFIDVGYFLAKLAATRASTRIGLFTIPNAGHPEGVRLANAYAALRELNHFHSAGSVFKAKYPGMGTVESLTATPFKSVFLCQPSSGDADAVEDVVRSFGQFIYLQAITPVGDTTAKELVNPNATRSGATDTFGNPMNFNSLGVSVIEFPAEHVVKGCTALLIARAVEQWFGQIVLDGVTALQLIRGQLRLETSVLSNDILTPPAGTLPYRDIVRTEIGRAVKAAQDGALDIMAEVQGSLDGAFDGKSSAGGKGLEKGSMEVQTRDNSNRLLKTRVEEIRVFMHEAMKDADRGPNFCLGLVKAIKNYCADQQSALHQETENHQQRLNLASAGLNDAWERIEDCHSAGVLKVPGYKRTALNICIQEYEEAMDALYFTKLDSMTTDGRYRIYEELRMVTEAYETRLGHGLYGLIPWANRLKQQLFSTHEKLVDTPPRVNGKLIYDASTIAYHYDRSIMAAKPDDNSRFRGTAPGEAYAKREVISDWEWIAEQLTTKDQSFFDVPRFDAEKNIDRPVKTSQYREVADAGRGYFITILRENVCKMLETADYATEVKSAFRKSNELIAIEDNPRNKAVSGDGPTALHKPRLAFFSNARDAADDSPAGKVRQALTGIIPRTNLNTLLAPYRIVFVTARATFSLSMIDGLRPEGNPDGDTLRRAYARLQAEDNRSYQTRIDVRWKSLESAFPFRGFQLLKARLLGALATNQMEFTSTNGLTLKYDLHSHGDRLGRLPLGKDLDEATFTLHDDSKAEGAFKMAMAKQEAAPFDYGPSLRDLSKKVTTYKLKDKGLPVDEAKCRELLRGYVLSVTGLKDNFDANLLMPTKQTFYCEAILPTPEQPDLVPKPEGYYCDCGAFIMDMESTELFPEFCNCGNRLRFDG